MAKGIKTGGKNFEPGNKLGGRKALPDDIKLARSLSYSDMCKTVIEVRNLTLKDIVKTNPDEMTLGKRAICRAYEDLDYNAIRGYEDRLWGKARESVDIHADKDVLDDFIEAFRMIK